MSSMHKNLRIKALACAAFGVFSLTTPSMAQTTGQGSGGNLLAQQPSQIDAAISKWELLQKNSELGFADYAGFAVAYPNYPRMEIIRSRAEKALTVEAPSRSDLLLFFDALPPLTNPGRARYAIALAGAGRVAAFDVAREAWRGGQMAEASELTLESLYARRFTAEDHAARMNALLWQGEAQAATRHMGKLAPKDRPLALARLALLNGSTPTEAGLPVPQGALRDAGYVYNLASHLRDRRDYGEAAAILASRPVATAPAYDGERMVGLMLAVAKKASVTNAMRIASRIDDLFEPGEDISQGSFLLRDRYTDLMWLGGTKALWQLGRGDQAAPLFERYGKAARTPLTKAKGFYWAGRAAQRAGNSVEAKRLFEAAAQWPDYYYAQLSLAALNRPMPDFAALPRPEVSAEDRRAFEAQPVAEALIAMSSNRRRWQTERRFFQALGESATSEAEMLMAHDLAARLGMPELSVVLGMKAGELGHSGIERIGYPTISTPIVRDWAMVHGISRQESEFDRTRVSHAGARGIMQLMPGTAREQSGKLGIRYMRADLIAKPQYNIELGDAYFQRMLAYYDGAYPLAVGAYNAGPGRVNQWLRLNGDPRRGDIDWVTWVERIPPNFETRYYIMRVLGNAVTYSHMYPDKAGLPRPIDAFLP
ncbi:MAG: lytic transglycosylase domain-containing protein [Erythrobacter sp.]|uniref:lytic transglycosylase domain-containing protein n=1 Tax=Erythrobacter sp. TaxID=1042 RepID=UPI00262B59D5|nr:lytic transglycosylase domain-containing protein [Erythrobacter sp.]MDJ0978029.1 lytic transglycosylase domain-containing protein [Erythrobacter sp.]